MARFRQEVKPFPLISPRSLPPPSPAPESHSNCPGETRPLQQLRTAVVVYYRGACLSISSWCMTIRRRFPYPVSHRLLGRRRGPRRRQAPSPTTSRRSPGARTRLAWQTTRALVGSGSSRGRRNGFVSPYALTALAALLASVLLGGVLARLWEQHAQRTVEKKWQARERLLNRRRPIATRQEVLRRRVRSRRSASIDRRNTRLPGRGRRSRQP